MANVSLRGISEEVKNELKTEARRRNQSVNALLLSFINKGIGRQEKRSYRTQYSDLDELAGTWTEEDAAEFEAAISSFNEIDESLWK